MSGVARITDWSSGHGCFPPQQTHVGSNNVFVNSLGVHRVGDTWPAHCCVTCHSSTTIQGSQTVFINGRAAARIGDFIDCGETVQTGSNNVFINS